MVFLLIHNYNYVLITTQEFNIVVINTAESQLWLCYFVITTWLSHNYDFVTLGYFFG